MRLYLKVLSFLKPYWKLVILSIILTFLFVIFSTIALWVSVNFIQEIFIPQPVTSQVETEGSTNHMTETEQGDQHRPNSNLIGFQRFGLYDKVNQTIKGFLVREDKYDTLKLICAIVFISFILRNVTYYFQKLINDYIQLNIVTNIRNKLHRQFIRLPLSYFDQHHSGKMTSVVFNDVNAVKNVLSNSFGKIISSPIQIINYLYWLVAISWKLSLFTFTIIPISGFLIVKIGQSIRRKSRRLFMRIADALSIFQETISSIRIVKAFTAESREENRFYTANKRYFLAHFRADRLKFLTSPLNEVLGSFIFVVLLWFGGRLVYAGEGLGAEDFIRFLLLLYALFQPMKDLSGLNNIIQTGMAAAERIFHAIEEPPEVYEKPNGKDISSFKESIVFDGVCFRYGEDGEDYVLNDIDFCINKGEMVAFVGHSGVGKSTLVDLIPRFYEVTEGRILIDGTDIRDLKLTSLRNQIGIVTQEPILFDDSVRMNIGYSRELTSDEDIIEAAKVANAWEFIQQMEDRLDTQIGEKGLKLSGGQKQRLTIARAVLKNTPILILDEATSSLDSESEKLVQEAIDNLMKNRTVLVIAHRLSTVIHADKIVVMDQGRIVKIGSHQELLKTCSVYRNLYEMQFRDQH